jgi:pimeloyl-ACP methyl ester carboxylesterase
MPFHHVVTGQGRPPVVFAHGFGCSHTATGPSGSALPSSPQNCRSSDGADVAEVMQALAVPVGHIMGCRVVIEAGDDPRGRRCLGR